MAKRILLIGGGGHCRSVLDAIRAAGIYEDLGIVDKHMEPGDSCMGAPVIGKDEDLPELFREGWRDACITVGSVGDTTIRRHIYTMLCTLGFSLPVVVDPTAVLASDSELHPGVFVGKRAIVNAGSKIEDCAIINTGAIIEHECMVGAFSHISPGAVLCGQTTVGKYTHIGAGTVIRQQIKIGSNTCIGMGSTVVKDIPDNVIAYGTPCRVIE